MPYTLEHGSYYWRTHHQPDGPIQKMCDEVALVVSYEDGQFVVHKHGSPENITQWWKDNRDHYRVIGLFSELQVVTFPPKFAAEKINRVLDTGGGYLKRFMQEVVCDQKLLT